MNIGSVSLVVLSLLLMESVPVNGLCQTCLSSTTRRIRPLLMISLADNNIEQDQPTGDGSDNDNSACKSLSLFEESVLQSPAAKFGESVPLRKPATSTVSDPIAFFGESVSMAHSSNTAEVAICSSSTVVDTLQQPPAEGAALLQSMKQRNLVVAIASVLLAVTTYVWQFTHPITPVQLLASMQSHSAPLTLIGTNGRPTVVDFWAPWCENCKMAAPTLASLEEEYKDKVNFVMVNGDKPEAWPLIERFGVDAIPHLALISADGDVETALIGPIPRRVLCADLNVLVANANAAAADDDAGQPTRQELPFKMLDAFAKYPELRRVNFVPSPAPGE
jgi:thiol-disulfide isomerase/thioredoxin